VTAASRRIVLLGAAGAVAVAAVMMARGSDPADVSATPARRGAGQAGSAAAAANVPVVDLKLELLQQHRPELEDSERNLFRFQPRVAPPAPADPRPTSAAKAAPPPPPIAVPSGPPPPPPIPLRFIGLVEAPTQAGRVAIFSDGRNNVFYGKDGDVIEGRYKVLKVSQDAAELSYVDGRGRQTIRLTGQ
jgi:hypothetical protein